MKDRRTTLSKLNTLLFGKDLRITKGDVYPQVRPNDYSSYYPEDDYITTQKIPESNVFDIRDFGADVCNPDNAEYINKAIDTAKECCGTVLVDGGEYVTTTICLKSNVTLFISRGSSLCANTTGVGYSHNCIVFADGESNITITGGGKVKGNGEYFGLKPLLDSNVTEHSKYIDVIEMRKVYRAQLRFAHPSKYGGVIYLKNCDSITAENFIIEDSAHWSFKIENCRNVNIKNFVINNNRNVANADGFDIAGSSNINIDHCFVSTADDGICIKNAIWLGCKGKMENINIRNCEVISRCNAFKIGTETTFEIANILVENCRFFMTDLYPGSVSGISVESADGSKVHDIVCKNIEMDRVTCPVFIRLCNRNRAALVDDKSANAVEFGKKIKNNPSAPKAQFDNKGEIYNIEISDITSKGAELPVIIAGYVQNKHKSYVSNVTLKNFSVEYAPYKEVYDKRMFVPEYSEEYPESWRFRNLSAYGVWARHVKGLKLLDYNCSIPRSTWKEKFVMEDVV